MSALARVAVYSASIAVVLAAGLLIGLGAAGYFGSTAGSRSSQPSTVTMTSGVTGIRAHRVTRAVIDDATRQVRLTYSAQATASGAASQAAAHTVVVQVPADYLGDLEQSLISAGVPVTVGEARSGSGTNLNLLAMLLALAAAAGLLAYRWHRRSVRRAAERAGNSSAVTVPDARFSDVAGCDEAIEDLRELVLFLQDPSASPEPAPGPRRVRCCAGRREPARRCWRGRSAASPGFRCSSPPAATSPRSSSASVPNGSGTCSPRPVPTSEPLCSSMSWTRWPGPDHSAVISAAASRSRP